MPNFTLSPEAVDWLAHGERGVSSNSIFQIMTGIPTVGQWGMSHPHDPSDLSRCLLLLEKCPEFKSRLSEMRIVSDKWKRLVDRWSEIESSFLSEAPANWRDGNSRWLSPKTYNLMRSVIK